MKKKLEVGIVTLINTDSREKAGIFFVESFCRVNHSTSIVFRDSVSAN